MIFIDTCVLIDYLRNKSNAIDFIDGIGKQNIIISTVTVIELYRGIRDKIEYKTLQKEVQKFNLLQIDNEISTVANKLAENYALSHHMSLGDCLIAATALVYDLNLVTHNIKDFRFIPTIKVSTIF